MAKVRYLASTKKPGLEFKIVNRRIDNSDEDNPKVYLTLEGTHGIQFERMVNDEILDKYGYTMKVLEVDDEGRPVPST